jgi:release factor glutamine methyltransferase
VASVAELLFEGAEHLRSGPHSDRNRADAELLLMHVLGRNRAWVLAHAEAIPSDQQASGFITLIERRYRGEPMQYIIGEAEFYGLPFTVTPDVLIPRPDTEHLVEKALELARVIEQPRIVDVGTGSGAIAVTLAHELPAAEITAIDLSEAALQVARGNAKRNGVEHRVRFLAGDLLAPVAGERFDLVVSNPPYVPDTDRALISVEVREFEPALALFGGQDGLAVHRRLLPAAYNALVSGGFIAIEMGFSQGDAIDELLQASGFVDIGVTADLQGIPRVASARRP